MSQILGVRHLEVHRGAIFNLEIAEFSLAQSEIVGLVGNNGAGKTTLLLTILDLLQKEEGEVQLFETTWSLDEVAIKRKIGAFLDETFLLNYMTVEEYFLWLQRAHALDGSETTMLIDKCLSLFEIDYQPLQLIRDLSEGNFVKVGLLGSILHRPRLVLWDEPFAHLDPRSKSQLLNLIDFYRSEFGTAFLISSHNIEELYHIVDTILVLDRGKVAAWDGKVNLGRDEINNLLGVSRAVASL
jgi:ABC-2 type transport system ATP-binding protein